MKKPVFLCGFMAAGKSTIGKILAERLCFAFADTDEEISRQAGMSVPQFISEYGFKQFRRMERDILSRLACGGKIIISCGGGLYPTSATSHIFSKGTSIFLDVPEEILAERILDNLPAYPKFAKYSSENAVRQEIGRLLAHRRIFYERCQIKIPCVSATPEAVADMIAGRVGL